MVEIMKFERECEEAKELMLKYDIPFHLFDEVYNILRDTVIERKMKEISFDEIVEYLKERATRDCYNRDVNHPEFREDCVYDWLFYLQEYSYYIGVILKKGTNWLCRDKRFYFPKDVFDITYKHQNARHNIFLKYMQEHYGESMFDEELEIK